MAPLKVEGNDPREEGSSEEGGRAGGAEAAPGASATASDLSALPLRYGTPRNLSAWIAISISNTPTHTSITEETMIYRRVDASLWQPMMSFHRECSKSGRISRG